MENSRASIFVDGACRNNGHNNPQGGCGVYWGPFHPMNSSEKLKGEKQTNNRAELSAALIAVAQSLKLGLQCIEISTDSKYVKEGITTWIKEWKLNDWKTSKKKGDVLNKDLWLMLDCLNDELCIEWKWVEGHQAIEGNTQADELAKKGIVAESGFWQELGGGLYADNRLKNASEANKTAITSKARQSTSRDMTTKSQSLCKKCETECAKDDYSIQCQDCKKWIHYGCSNLPSYQLYLYENTQRHYTCEFCVDIDECYNFSTEKNASSYRDAIPTTMNDVCKVNAYTMTATIGTDEKITDTSDIYYQSTVEPSKISSSCQTDQMLNSNDFVQEGLESFKKSTVNQLEESFVNAFDKINNSIREMKLSRDEEHALKQQILDLKKENERLRALNSKDTDGKKAEQNCQKCIEVKSSMEKQNRNIEKDKETVQHNLYKMKLDTELQESKLRSEISLLKHKLDLSSKQVSIQLSDVSMMEKRLEAKNELIISLEANMCKLSKKVHELQDEILAWKLHDSRVDDSLTRGHMNAKDCQDVITPKQNQVQDAAENHIEVSEGNKSYKDALITENTNKDQPDKIRKNDIQTGSRTKNNDKVSCSSKTRNVQIVGTSNTKFLSPEYIGEDEFSVSKTTKYTLRETYDYFQNLQPTENQDVFILHSLCNEFQDKSPEECTEGIAQIVDTITTKFDKTKVIVSLGLPRSDLNSNRKIEKANVLIKEKLDGKRGVYVCDNGNLFYRGEAQRGILNQDGVHLSRTGTRKLGKNIKELLWDLFDLPLVVSVSHDGTRESGTARHRYSYNGEYRSANKYLDDTRESGTAQDRYSYNGEYRSTNKYHNNNRRNTFYRDTESFDQRSVYRPRPNFRDGNRNSYPRQLSDTYSRRGYNDNYIRR